MPIEWGYPIAAAIGGLAGFLGGKAKEKEAKRQRRWEEQMLREEAARRRGAIAALTDYGYQPFYETALGQETGLAAMLRGELTPTQQALLAEQRRLGEEAIARRAAGMGLPAGGRAALYTQLARDVALGGAQMAEEQRRWAHQMALADWLRQQEARMRAQELRAAYAPGIY